MRNVSDADFGPLIFTNNALSEILQWKIVDPRRMTQLRYDTNELSIMLNEYLIAKRPESSKVI